MGSCPPIPSSICMPDLNVFFLSQMQYIDIFIFQICTTCIISEYVVFYRIKKS